MSTLARPRDRFHDLREAARARSRKEYPQAAEQVREMYRAARSHRLWISRSDDYNVIRVARAVAAVDRMRNAS